MPKYEYNCVTCETSVEITRSFNDPENVPPCPKCGYNMSKVWNNVGVQFKGSGFYSTDKGKR